MKRAAIISSPDVLDGTPVFAGTEIPVRILFERLADGASLSDILKDNPKLKREQVVAVLHQADAAIEQTLSPDHIAELEEDEAIEFWAKAEDARLERLKAEIKLGLDQANRGELVENEEVWKSVYATIDRVENDRRA